jgi:hypothetical protein
MTHCLFSNRQLASDLCTLDQLKKHPEMQQFIRWARKQDPDKRVKIQSPDQ